MPGSIGRFNRNRPKFAVYVCMTAGSTSICWRVMTKDELMRARTAHVQNPPGSRHRTNHRLWGTSRCAAAEMGEMSHCPWSAQRNADLLAVPAHGLREHAGAHPQSWPKRSTYRRSQSWDRWLECSGRRGAIPLLEHNSTTGEITVLTLDC